jgi:predicted NAD/FAD-binding protein
MNKPSVAIIGTGAAGLACGHILHKQYDITVYEQNDYLGGHANSVTIEYQGETVRFDTAFVVFNNVAYPHFMGMLEELKVPSMYCPMSFSFQIMPDGLQYKTHGLTYCFCDIENLINPRFLKMLYEMLKFYRQVREVLTDPRYRDYSISQYLKEKGYSDAFLHYFLIPLIAVTWSVPPEKMLAYPIYTLVDFLKSHGALQGLVGGSHWRTVVNGSRSYVEKISEPFRDRIHTNRGVSRVRRVNGRVEVTDTAGASTMYDHAILACHADQALAMLGDPTPLEQELLSKFEYNGSRVVVHTDGSLMPKKKRHWAGWNYYVHYAHKDDLNPKSSFTYHMNTLQKVAAKHDYFVTIGDSDRVDPRTILKEFLYHHPTFDVAASKAQAELHRLNENGLVFYCGSYFKFGFHEDAFRSGVEASRKLMGANIPR